jgi:hypothetical protein
MSAPSNHQGVVTINLDMKVVPTNGGPSRLFERGQQFYHFGTNTIKVGCTPCGSALMVPFWIVICDELTYNLDSRYSSENVPTGPIPSIIDRVNNLGDGFTSSPTSDQVSISEQSRNANFKLIM